MSIQDTFVFGPGFRDFDKFFVGFDDHFNHLNQLAQDVTRNTSGYPPYNITKLDDTRYAIELAVAGFDESEIDIEYAENKLTVTGNKTPAEGTEFVHRGIATRDFTRTFGLNDDVVVSGADLRNGLLTVALERIIPEAKKPKKIAIGSIPSISTGIDRVRELLAEKEKVKQSD